MNHLIQKANAVLFGVTFAFGGFTLVNSPSAQAAAKKPKCRASYGSVNCPKGTHVEASSQHEDAYTQNGTTCCKYDRFLKSCQINPKGGKNQYYVSHRVRVLIGPMSNQKCPKDIDEY